MTPTRFVQRLAALSLLSAAACGGSSPTSPTSPPRAASTTTTGTTPVSLPAMYGKFGNGVQVSLAGTTVVLTTTDVPDHPSPYFGVGNPNYETPQPGMVV